MRIATMQIDDVPAGHADVSKNVKETATTQPYSHFDQSSERMPASAYIHLSTIIMSFQQEIVRKWFSEHRKQCFLKHYALARSLRVLVFAGVGVIS